MLTPEEAQRLTGMNLRTIYQWIESGRVHFLEEASGELMICLAPLGVDIVVQRAAADRVD